MQVCTQAAPVLPLTMFPTIMQAGPVLPPTFQFRKLPVRQAPVPVRPIEAFESNRGAEQIVCDDQLTQCGRARGY